MSDLGSIGTALQYSFEHAGFGIPGAAGYQGQGITPVEMTAAANEFLYLRYFGIPGAAGYLGRDNSPPLIRWLDPFVFLRPYAQQILTRSTPIQ